MSSFVWRHVMWVVTRSPVPPGPALCTALCVVAWRGCGRHRFQQSKGVIPTTSVAEPLSVSAAAQRLAKVSDPVVVRSSSKQRSWLVWIGWRSSSPPCFSAV